MIVNKSILSESKYFLVKRIFAFLILIIIANPISALVFRSDSDENIIQDSHKLATTIKYAENAVWIFFSQGVSTTDYLNTISCSGWLLNNRTVLTVAHCASLFSLDEIEEAYVTNDPVTNINKGATNKYKIEKIIIHPSYKATKIQSESELGLNLPKTYEELWDVVSRVANLPFRNQFQLIDSEGKMIDITQKVTGTDLAILHLSKPVPNIVPIDLYDKPLPSTINAIFYSYGDIYVNKKKLNKQGFYYRQYGVIPINFSSKLDVLYSEWVSTGGEALSFDYDINVANKYLSHSAPFDSGSGIIIQDPYDHQLKLLAIDKGATTMELHGLSKFKIPNYDIFIPVGPNSDWIRKNLITYSILKEEL